MTPATTASSTPAPNADLEGRNGPAEGCSEPAAEIEEQLIEEVSIDGLCGVY